MHSQTKAAIKRKLSYIPEIPQRKIFRFDKDQGQPQPSTSKAFWNLELQKRNKANYDKYQTSSFQNGGFPVSAGESSRMWLQVRFTKLGDHEGHAKVRSEVGKIIRQCEVQNPGQKFDQYDSPEVLEELCGLMVPGNLYHSTGGDANRNGFNAPPASPMKMISDQKNIYDDYQDDTDDDSDSNQDSKFKIAWKGYMVQKAQLSGLRYRGNGNDWLQFDHLERSKKELEHKEVEGAAAGKLLTPSDEISEQEDRELLEFLNEMKIQA